MLIFQGVNSWISSTPSWDSRKRARGAIACKPWRRKQGVERWSWDPLGCQGQDLLGSMVVIIHIYIYILYTPHLYITHGQFFQDLGGGFNYFFIFTPIWGNDPI